MLRDREDKWRELGEVEREKKLWREQGRREGWREKRGRLKENKEGRMEKLGEKVEENKD